MAENSSLNVSTSLAVKRTECVGSATGNPRNKCALKPGHSLLDWIRLSNSGEDLSGQRGRITPITLDELAKHKYRNDAWLAINGQVYNVTRYMDFHPGGWYYLCAFSYTIFALNSIQLFVKVWMN